MSGTLDRTVKTFIAQSTDGQRENANKTLSELRQRLLEQENDGLTDADLQAVVKTSLKERFLPEAESFLESMAVADRLMPENQLDLAQVAIETDRHQTGMAVLERFLPKASEDPELYAEAMGISGRAHKDLFLKALKGNRSAAARHLNQAMQSYDAGRTGAPQKQNWLIGNLLALESRARLEGIEPPQRIDTEALADLIETSTAQIPEAERHFYQWSSLAEARLSRQNWDEAGDAVNAMIAAEDADVFKLNSTLRQFKNVWQVQRHGAQPQLILTALEHSIITRRNGEIVMDAADVVRHRNTQESDLEAQFSHDLLRGQSWVKKFLKMGNSVTSVVDRNTGAVRGTCCIVNGGDIAPEFEGRLLGLTNDHVISEHPRDYQVNQPLQPQHAAIRFTLSEDPDREYPIQEVLWSSPFALHDACLFTFRDPLPLAKSDLEMIDYLPPAPTDPPAAVFVISHPYSDEPSYSFQNTDLLMHDADMRGPDTVLPGFIHYKTGTIKGSSGGIALNAKLKVIGLHHAGGDTMGRIDGEPGTHAANEAIWIVALLNAVRADMAKGHRRATPPVH